jgi:hypothetical protein
MFLPREDTMVAKVRVFCVINSRIRGIRLKKKTETPKLLELNKKQSKIKINPTKKEIHKTTKNSPYY